LNDGRRAWAMVCDVMMSSRCRHAERSRSAASGEPLLPLVGCSGVAAWLPRATVAGRTGGLWPTARYAAWSTGFRLSRP
jgi:hypothetical protein